jgi:hypothetical protein
MVLKNPLRVVKNNLKKALDPLAVQEKRFAKPAPPKGQKAP